MNTKILVMLVIGITLVGLTGAASACETVSENLFYEFVKILEGQTAPGSDVEVDIMDVTKSGAFFQEGVCCELKDPDNAGILNTLEEIKATLASSNAEYTGTLTQKGWATVIKRPRSGDVDLPELEASTLATQKLTTTGSQTLAAAKFDSEAYTGTSYYDVVAGYPGSGPCKKTGTIYAKAGLKNPVETSVEAFKAQFGSATMGMTLSTSLIADPDVDNQKVFMDGGSSAYSRFTDAKLNERKGIITTSSAITACHEWGDQCCGYGSGLDMDVNIDCPGDG